MTFISYAIILFTYFWMLKSLIGESGDGGFILIGGIVLMTMTWKFSHRFIVMLSFKIYDLIYTEAFANYIDKQEKVAQGKHADIKAIGDEF